MWECCDTLSASDHESGDMVVVMMEELSYWGWIEELDPIEWAVEYPYSEHQNQHGQPWKWRTGGPSSRWSGLL